MPNHTPSSSCCYAHTQNFLTGKQLLETITALSGIGRRDIVLEIGTGKGHLSSVLAKRCRILYTIEIDKMLYRKAQRILSPFTNIRMIYGDFMQFVLPKQAPYKVFSNIPFSGTSRIVRKLLYAANPPSDVWLVMEKGAAKRYCGIPRESMQSLLLKPMWTIKIIYHFQRKDFHPSPSVDSCLIHFSLKQQPDIPPKSWKKYTCFVEHSIRFGQYNEKCLLTKRQVFQALRHAGFTSEHGGRNECYEQWLCLFRYWISLNHHAAKR